MSGPLPAGELADMRATVSASFDTACTIQRKNTTRTAEGYPVDGYATIATTTCNLTQPPIAMLQNYSDLIGPNETWLIRLAWNQDVLRDDQITVSGILMRVQVVMNPQSYSCDTRVLAAKVV